MVHIRQAAVVIALLVHGTSATDLEVVPGGVRERYDEGEPTTGNRPPTRSQDRSGQDASLRVAYHDRRTSSDITVGTGPDTRTLAARAPVVVIHKKQIAPNVGPRLRGRRTHRATRTDDDGNRRDYGNRRSQRTTVPTRT
jgi:hypothetical protein